MNEVREAISDNTHSIGRERALRQEMVGTLGSAQNIILAQRGRVDAMRSAHDALQATVVSLPRNLAISRLGGRITNLDERFHSLAVTVTDHSELVSDRAAALIAAAAALRAADLLV